jgi:cytochrome oxidase Cu insertion factor (SCO1/SenC/PrrC family)
MVRRLWAGLLLALPVCLMAGDDATGQHRGRGERGRQKNRPKLGEKLKDFELKDVKGKAIHLSDFKEKIFILELGACT